MNKAVIAVLAIVVVAVLVGGPLWMAGRVQDQHEEVVQALSEAAGPEGFETTRTGYQKGWLQSSATTRVRITEELAKETELPAGCVELATKYRHGHGQLLRGKLLEARTTLVDDPEATECLGPKAGKTLEQLFDGEEPVVVTTVTDIGGNTELRGRTAAVDAVVGNPDDELGVVSEPMALNARITRGGDRYRLHFGWPGGEFRETGETGSRVRFGGMTLEQDGRRVNDWLWTGDSRYSLDQLAVRVHQEGGPVRSGLDELVLTSEVRQSGDKVNSGFGLGVADARLGGRDWGSLRLRMRFDDVAMKPLGRFTQWLEEGLAESEALGEQSSDLERNMGREVRALLKGVVNDIQIGLTELTFRRDEALASASGQASFQEMEERALEMIASQPGLLLAKLDARARGSMNDAMVGLWAAMQRVVARAQSESGADVPKREALAKQLRSRLDGYAERGWVTREDGRYAVEAQWRQGRLMLNGNPVGR